jgi:hypothetical protein
MPHLRRKKLERDFIREEYLDNFLSAVRLLKESLVQAIEKTVESKGSGEHKLHRNWLTQTMDSLNIDVPTRDAVYVEFSNAQRKEYDKSKPGWITFTRPDKDPSKRLM